MPGLDAILFDNYVRPLMRIIALYPDDQPTIKQLLIKRLLIIRKSHDAEFCNRLYETLNFLEIEEAICAANKILIEPSPQEKPKQTSCPNSGCSYKTHFTGNLNRHLRFSCKFKTKKN